METAVIVKVAVSAAPYSIDKPYDYLVPEPLLETAVPGVRVTVPFGRGNRSSEGIILARTTGEKSQGLKPLASVLDREPVLDSDGIALALSVSDYLSREGISLKQAERLLPQYASAARFIPIDRSSRALRGLSDVRSPQSADEGIMLDESGSRVFIRPVKTGKGLMMYVESMSIEAASEICDIYEEKLVREDKLYQ